MKHELVHCKRNDLWYKLLVLVTTVLHWFNPVVSLMARAIEGLCEISCDAQVVLGANADMRQQYCETILSVVRYQPKLKTALSTNFYRGKKGMKKRILSIMDTGKKRAGIGVICFALLLTLGTGTAFAVNDAEHVPENAPSTGVTYAGGDQNSTTVKWEPLPEYESFGISYNAEGKMLFDGQLVRYFWDGYHVDGNSFATHYDCLNEAGVIDVHTVRSIIDNGDGSVDMFGELTDIAAYTQQEFDARDIAGLKDTGSGPAETAVDGSGSDTGGRTFAEILSQYKAYGIDFTPAIGRGGMGNITYRGQAVKTFVDESNAGGVFMLQSIDGGELTVRTVYDANGNLTGVAADN